MFSSPSIAKSQDVRKTNESPISPYVTGSHHVMNHLIKKKSPFPGKDIATNPSEGNNNDNNSNNDEKAVDTSGSSSSNSNSSSSSKPLIRGPESKPILDKLRNPTPNQSIEYHLAKKSPTAVTQSPTADSPSHLKSLRSIDPDDKLKGIDDSDDSKSKKIYEAASRGDFISLCKSIEDDVDCVGVNYKGGYGLTALIISAEKGQVVAVRMLIRAGSDVNVTSNWGYSALHRAAQNGHTACVNELIAAKANVNLQDRDGLTPLMQAFAKNHEDCILALVKANANLDLNNIDGKTAAECSNDEEFKSQVMAKIEAHFKEQEQTLNLLRLKKPDVIIFEYLKSGNVQGLQDLLQNDSGLINSKFMPFDEDLKDFEGDTPLILSSFHGSAQCLRVLLEYKVDVNEQSKDGKSALIYSCVNGNIECVKVLMEYGINVNTRSFYGNTSLNYSAYYGRTEIVKMLIDANCDIDVANNDGKTALMNASSRGYLEIVGLLLAANANISLTNNKGLTAYDVAKKSVIKDIIRNSTQSRALESKKEKAKEDEEKEMKTREDKLIKFREQQSEDLKIAEVEREQLLKLIREREAKKRQTETEGEKKAKERCEAEEKRLRREVERKQVEIMREKREEMRREELRAAEIKCFNSEKKALLSLINERQRKKMAYVEKLAALEMDLSKTKPLPLPVVPRVKAKVHVSNSEPISGEEDSKDSEVPLFLRKIGLEQYTDFFHSNGADRLSDFSYYANGSFDQIKILLPEFATTLKHFHQIRFYEALRNYFNISNHASPARSSPNSSARASPQSEFTAAAFVSELVTGKKAF